MFPDMVDEPTAKSPAGKENPSPAPAAAIGDTLIIPRWESPAPAVTTPKVEEPPDPKSPVLQFLEPSRIASSKPSAAPAPVLVPVIVRTPVTDAPEALVASLEQSIALITERKVTLTIMRSADHPVMGEMWVGMLKIVPGSGYGDHLRPIIGGTPIEVAMSAALALGKAQGR